MINIESEKSDLVYGVHAVKEALKMDLVNKLYLEEGMKGKNVQIIREMASSKKVAISRMSKADLNKLSDQGVHQGFLARVTEFAYSELADLLEKFKNRKTGTVLILDQLTDPHNLGSIARTADATGVDGIIIPKHRSVGMTPVAIKASTGALQHVPVTRVTNLSQSLEKLKAAGFWIFGTDIKGTAYTKWNTQGKIALIIGNEGKGMSLGLKKQVDEMITIPMVGHVQSLNASIAAAILMYRIFENRNWTS